MTRIDFYFNVDNKQQLLADLVQAALTKRRQVTILTDNAEKAAELSTSLWQQSATSFLPNVLVNDDLAAQTPVLLHWPDNALPQNAITQDDMLINLTAAEPSFFSRFTHLVELVGDEEQDKMRARERYKFYRDRGYDIKNINHAQT